MEESDDQDSTNHQNSEKLELLELERREIIGEILKLNPNYKAPADYKPLLKEDKVVIPIKEYPERNFIEVLFAGDTIKRLEKETGTKIRVYGTKADTETESEITSYDGNEVHYEELSVHITGETYDKVDNAVSLIELLITPVPANAIPDPIQVPVSEDINPTAVSVTQPPPLPQFPRPPNQWQLPASAPPFPNLSVSVPHFPNLPVSTSLNPQPPLPLHRPPNMGYAGPPRNPMPRQQNFPPPNIRPNWSQPPPNHVPPPPPPVRSIPPPITALRPQPPISNDFTFQTHRPSPPQRPVSHFMPPPQQPSFRPPPPPMMQQGNFRRPQNSHQFGQSSRPNRRPDFFSGHGPPPPPPRPGNFGQVQQNHHPSMQFKPQNFLPRGNVPYNNSLGRPGVPRQQIYDPFSASGTGKPGNSQSLRKQESDPEYDDLMASVGVK